MESIESAPAQMQLECRLQKEAAWDSLKEKKKSLFPHTQTYLKAATATTDDKIVLLVSFPPNPPPILFTRTTTRFEGTPRALAANS